MEFLRVSENSRYLEKENGDPFFWLGDTCWEIFHRMTLEEAIAYLDKRQEQEFTVVQAVALAELDGMTTPNANGHYPLVPDEHGQFIEIQPDLEGEDNYWTHVDAIIDAALERNLYVAFLPNWGDKWNAMGKNGPEFLNAENAYEYASFLAKRYGHLPNIIWVLQGDRPLFKRKHFEVSSALARGIRDHADPRQLITAHPGGHDSSSRYFHEEPWLDFNMIQSTHLETNYPNYRFVAADRALEPVKPTFDAEPRYEDHPIDFDPAHGYYDAFDVRQGVYWAVLAGGLGVTYGHHSVWAVNREPSAYWPVPWKEALDRPAAWQMRYLRQAIESVDFRNGEPRQDLVIDPLSGANYVAVFASDEFLLAYSPNGLPFELNLDVWLDSSLSKETISSHWFDPRTGNMLVCEAMDEGRFLSPSAGRGHDWLLCLRKGSYLED